MKKTRNGVGRHIRLRRDVNERQLVALDERIPTLNHGIFGDGTEGEHLGVHNATHGRETDEMVATLNTFLEGVHFFDQGGPFELAIIVKPAVHC